MSGSDHYGKIMARSFSDRRLHVAGAHLAASGAVNEELAVLTIVGTIAALNFRLLEDGDTGVLPGTGREMMRVAAFCSPAMADALIAALKAGDLLVESDGGLRLRGFDSVNERILSARKYQRGKRKRTNDRRPTAPPTRPPTAPPTTSKEVDVEVDVEVKGKESPPPPFTATAGDSASPEPATAAAKAPEEPPVVTPQSDPTEPALMAVVREVLGDDSRQWRGNYATWRKFIDAAQSVGVDAKLLRAAVSERPKAPPWETVDPLTKKAAAALEAKKRHEADLARSERERRARFENECRVAATWGPERLTAWLDKLPPNRRPEAEAILHPPRAAS